MGLSNATIYSTSGNFTVSVIDANTGASLGQQTFGYAVQGNSLYAQDPTGLHDWLQQFSGYSSVDVYVQVEPQVQVTNAGTVSATDNAEY